jgi:hypothetical protein
MDEGGGGVASVFIGAIPEELDLLGGTFSSYAADLHRLAEWLGTQISTASWLGPDVDNFQARWQGELCPQLRGAAQLLDDAGRRLHEQARQQRDASQPIRGGATGVPPALQPHANPSWLPPVHGSRSVSLQLDHNGLTASGAIEKSLGWDASTSASAAALAGFAAAHGEASVFAGAKAGANGTIKVGVDGVGASGHSEAMIGEQAQASGNARLGNLATVEGSASALLGARAAADGTATLAVKGMDVTGHAEAIVGAQAEASVSAHLADVVMLDGSASALAGARASADGRVHVGADGATVDASVEAFAGAEAKAEASATSFGTTETVGVRAYAGMGAQFDEKASISIKEIEFSVDAGAAVGVGAGVKLGADVKPAEVFRGVHEELGSWERSFHRHLR